jgi:polyhydroxybutyrate depolymerase
MSHPSARFAARIATAIAVAVAALVGGAMLRAFPPRAPVAGDHSGAIEIGGRVRTYLLHVPPGYDPRSRVPLVIVLHGAMQSAASAERMSGMSVLADRENFLVAYPRGTSRSGRAPTWNAGDCCGFALKNQIDDVAFLRALITALEGGYTVDPKRIYVTGISNGGMMSYRAACELADQVAAVAPVEGAQNIVCHPSSPVSVIVFHGTADRLVPFEGGATPFQMGPPRSDTPVATTVTFWAKQDGCSPTPKHEETPQLHIDAYSNCQRGTGVALYAIQGGRHMWPGTRFSRNNVAATEIMWKFFVQHPKP